MKLCKDCKHAVLPHPLSQLANYSGQASVYVAMCGHPDARRSVIDGSLEVSCKLARAEYTEATRDSICGAAAKLFEEAPPPLEPEIKPYQVMHVETEEDRAIWKKVKRWFI